MTPEERERQHCFEAALSWMRAHPAFNASHLADLIERERADAVNTSRKNGVFASVLRWWLTGG